MIRRVVLGAINCIALASTAYGADIYSPGAVNYGTPAVPIISFAGFYAGINGGYGGYNDAGFRDVTAAPVSSFSAGGNLSGGFGGGQAGYNWQFGHFVAGFETDIQGSDIRASAAQARIVPIPLSGAFARTALDVNYFGTVRGKLGYAFGGALLYATGGFAYGGAETSASYEDTAGDLGHAGNSRTLTGWTVGGGLEFKLTPNWSLKGEYQYIDLSSSSAYGPVTLAGATVGTLHGNADVRFNTVRVGVNYYFATAYEPLPMK